MVTIYLPKNSERVTYIVSHLFQAILGTDFLFVDEKEVFLRSETPCINYSHENLRKGIRIKPHTLLYETGLSPQTLEWDEWNGLPCFFAQPEADIPFDLFAASFYLLSRYEEYGSAKTDLHGRFPAEESLAYQAHFLEIPLVDRWVHFLKEEIEKTAKLDCVPRTFKFVSTLDIDHPFCYRNKGLLKNLAGGIKDLLRQDRTALKDRLLTQLHKQEDPFFRAIQDMVDAHRKNDLDLFAFVHVGDYGAYDRRTIYPHRRLYDYLHSLYTVRLGLHPSYKASFSPERIRKEKGRLEAKVKHPVRRSRQHFLRMRFPDTCRMLNELDFTEDFTLAYASHPGFRASTSIPFFFFDVERNIRTELLVRPTTVMDTTFMEYLKASPQEASTKIKQLMLESYTSGGEFVMLWHNSNLTHSECNPWFEVFSEILSFGAGLKSS